MDDTSVVDALRSALRDAHERDSIETNTKLRDATCALIAARKNAGKSVSDIIVEVKQITGDTGGVLTRERLTTSTVRWRIEFFYDVELRTPPDSAVTRDH